MQTATLVHTPAAPAPKLDPADRTRETFRLAYRQARSMIRDGGRHGLGARYVHCLDHMRRRCARYTRRPLLAELASWSNVHAMLNPCSRSRSNDAQR